MSPIYVHLLVNQTPVAATVFGVAMLAYAVARGRESLERTSLGMFVFAALAAVATFVTGKRAEGGVDEVGSVPAVLIDQHHALARLATLSVVALGAASLAILLSTRRRRLPRRLAALLLVASLAPAAALVWTATRGGRIRHPEIRPNAQVRRTATAHADEVGVYEP